MTQLQTEEQFRAWAHQNLPRLRRRPAVEVADELAEALLCLDPQLGVEVGDEDVEEREVILTAFSDPSKFSLVRRLRDLLSGVEGWRFRALKPPRGFDFTLTVGTQKLRADDLEFAPIPGIENGIALVIPGFDSPSLPDLSGAEAEELAWLTVETGIGEEKAAKLQHIEFARAAEFPVRRRIADLGHFLGREG